MTTTALDASPAVPAAPVKVLVRARAALVDRRRADVHLIDAAVEWAHAHPAPNAQEVAGWGDGIMYGEGFLPLAGEGAPAVAEFAPFDLAAALGWSTDATRALMGDGLELVHRLPGLWALVCELKVSAATARYAAEQTRDLAFEAAAHADRLLTRAIGVGLLSSRRIRALVDEARLYHDPDRAIDDELHALASRSVELTPGNTPATTEVAMVLDTADAEPFDKTVSQIAAQLGLLGDHDSLDIRRARAVGILADPLAALDLFADGETTRRTPAKPSTLYLHLDQSALLGLDTFPAGIRAEGPRLGMGVLSSDLLAIWLADATVVVKPVIDLDRPTRPSTATTRPSRWSSSSGCEIRSASSPVANAPPDPATWTTSRPTSLSMKADHPARPTPTSSPRSAEATTARRPSADGTTDACPTAATGGPRLRDRSTSSRHAHAELSARDRRVGRVTRR